MFRVAIICALLTGCAAAEAVRLSREADTARAGLIGLERTDVLSCMGAPLAQARIGSTEVWEYRASAVHAAGGVIHDRQCQASIEFTDGAVSNVRYRGDAGGAFAPQALCGQIVSGCV